MSISTMLSLPSVRRSDIFYDFDLMSSDRKTEFFTPKSNVIENSSSFIVEIEAPGFSKELINISINGDSLDVSTSESATDGLAEGVTHEEFFLKKMRRSFKIPSTVDKSAISADYRYGILTITLPKEKVDIKKEIEVTGE